MCASIHAPAAAAAVTLPECVVVCALCACVCRCTFVFLFVRLVGSLVVCDMPVSACRCTHPHGHALVLLLLIAFVLSLCGQDDPTAQRRLRLSRAESEAREASSSDLGLTNPGGMVEYGACTACNALESCAVAVTPLP